MLGKTALSLWPVGVALLAGAGLPFQAASNAAVGRALGHPLWGAIASLVLSAMVILPLLGAQRAAAPTISTAYKGRGGCGWAAFLALCMLAALPQSRQSWAPAASWSALSLGRW